MVARHGTWVTGIVDNMKISGSGTIKGDFIDIKVCHKSFQVNGYYMNGLNET